MSKQKLLVLLSVLLVLAMALTACPAPAAPAAEAPAAAATEAPVAEAPAAEVPAAEAPAAPAAAAFKVGFVTDVGRVNDRSFNQSAWEGVVEFANAMGLTEDDYRYIETQDTKDYADNMQQFIDNGFNVIITSGFGMGDATLAAAKANPDIMFIGVDQFQGEALPNLTGLIFHEDQSGYLAGVLAARLTKSGTIAAVLGTDLVPPVVAFNEGYKAGALSVNPDLNIISTYHPGGMDVAFTDPEWGAATAKQAMDQGADVVFAAGGLTGNGGLQEVAVAASAGAEAYCIGVDSDQWFTVEAAHPCLVSSAMKLITPGVVGLLTDAMNGSFPGGNYFGGSGLAPFHDFDAKVPQEVKDELVTIKAGLDDGSVTTGYGQ